MNVELPFLAEGIEGGDVVQILIREGDRVHEGEPLIELETEKATVPVPSPAAGTITRLLVNPGDHLKVGQVLAELDNAAGAPPLKPPTAETTSPASARQMSPVETLQTPADKEPTAPQTDLSATTTPPSEHQQANTDQSNCPPSIGSTIPAPPSVRRLARELGVDLTQVSGSEAGGRITAEDVKTYVRERTRRSSGPRQDDGRNVFSTMYGNERREPLPSIRRKIAANMTQAWTTIPHVHQFQEADITDLLQLHKRYAPQFKRKGATLTLTSLLLKAVVHALKLYPQLNATLDLTNGEVIYKDYYNIGVAVDTAAGLIVPVVHNVDQKDLFHISIELADLAERTRKREVTLAELRGATFTVSNMGGIGAGPFTPIINPPQVGILGVGRARMMPVYRDGQFVPRKILNLCVAYDHRLVDGVVGARFTNEIVKVLEDFEAMFLGL